MMPLEKKGVEVQPFLSQDFNYKNKFPKIVRTAMGDLQVISVSDSQQMSYPKEITEFANQTLNKIRQQPFANTLQKQKELRTLATFISKHADFCKIQSQASYWEGAKFLLGMGIKAGLEDEESLQKTIDLDATSLQEAVSQEAEMIQQFVQNLQTNIGKNNSFDWNANSEKKAVEFIKENKMYVSSRQDVKWVFWFDSKTNQLMKTRLTPDQHIDKLRDSWIGWTYKQDTTPICQIIIEDQKPTLIFTNGFKTSEVDNGSREIFLRYNNPASSPTTR